MRQLLRQKFKSRRGREAHVHVTRPNNEAQEGISQRVNDGPPSSKTSQNRVSEEASEQGYTPDTMAREGLIQIRDYQSSYGQKTRADIVAIHGLNGHPFKTWTEHGVVWFSDLLPKQLPSMDLRVFTFGYNSQVLFSGTTLGVRDFATQLLSSLQLKRKETSTESVPIIFICHSLGGVVFKKMLVMAHERQNLYTDIQTSTKSVIFFGTPHGGSGVAGLTRVLRNIFDLCTMGSVRADLLKNLERKSAELAELAEQFVERASQLKIVTVYEGRPLKPAPASFPVVVDKVSAVLNLTNERVIPVDADHRAICRFWSSEDTRFQYILFAVSNVIKESLALEDTKLKVCLEMLYFDSYKQRRSNVLDPYANTFLWILDHPKYQTWENGRASSLLWLQGKAGSGKSTLAKFVRARVHERIDHRPDTRSVVVDFFYSARGGSLQNGHYWMLRSVLYQLLLKAPELWNSYLNDFNECHQKEQSDTWRNSARARSDQPPDLLWSFDRLKSLFDALGSIHTPWLRLTAYVIIDALDESEEPHRQEMIQMFRKASMKHPSWPITYKIFLTSRPSPRIEQVLQGRATIVLEDETQKDIIEYVNSETNRIATTILYCAHTELAFVSSYLIKWAQGVFLWVRLVLIELDDKTTEGFCSVAELENLLISIPKDLRQLYERILAHIKTGQPYTVRECQTVFRWVAFSPRPLSTEEMLEIVAVSACTDSQLSSTELQRRRVGNTEDMRRRLISLCGNLVEVKGGTVQFIHTSVREYLLESVCDKRISLLREQSLFEIASLCTNYVEYFHGMIQQTPVEKRNELSIGRKIVGAFTSFSPLVSINDEVSAELDHVEQYVDYIDQLVLLRFIYGCDKAFIIGLDHELERGSTGRSLTDAMFSACTGLRPALIESVLAGKIDILGRLILYAGQINTLYPLPLGDGRINQTLARSAVTTDNYKGTLLHMISFLDESRALDTVDLLYKNGANPNLLDELGQTPLQVAVQAGTRAYEILSDLIYQRSMPTITNGIINLQTPFLQASRSAGNELFSKEIAAMNKPCWILTSAVRFGTNQLLKDMLAQSVSLQALLASIAEYGDKELKSIVWTLKSTHRKLSKSSASRLFSTYGGDKIDACTIWIKVASKTRDQELTKAIHTLSHVRSLISRLLQHGADSSLPGNGSSTKIPVDIALHAGDEEVIFPLLHSLYEQTQVKLSLAKTKAEKSIILGSVSELLSPLIYHEIAEFNSCIILLWLLRVDFALDIAKALDTYRDEQGNSAMHIATIKGHYVTVLYLVSIGCKKNVIDAQGRTPMDLAILNRKGRVVFSLLDDKERKARKVSRTLWSWKDLGYVLVE